MLREIPLARHAWELLKPLEANADTINAVRHLPTQFHLGPPKLDANGSFFRPSYGNILISPSSDSPLSPGTEMLSPTQFHHLYSNESTSTQQSSLIPGSPGFHQTLDSPLTDFSQSNHLSSLEGAVEVPLPLFSTPPLATETPTRLVRHETANSSVMFGPVSSSNKKPALIASQPEKSKSTFWNMISGGGGSKKEPPSPSTNPSFLPSNIESQRLDEIPLRNLSSSQKISVRGRGARNISVCLSQNSTHALFWTQSTIHLWDVGPTPSSMRREFSTGGNCVLAAVTNVHLAYIVGIADQKMTVWHPFRSNSHD